MADRPTVRPASPHDAQAIAALLAAGSRAPEVEAPDDPARYVAAIERIRETRGEVLVAELGGEVVGVLQLILLAHLQHAGGAATEIESVHVAADSRRRGVGRALLDAAVAWAGERGCYRVQLTSHVTREGAHRFYDECGFEATHVGYRRSLDPAAPSP
jgi:GNAT superfamily N-acetyltransferase